MGVAELITVYDSVEEAKRDGNEDLLAMEILMVLVVGSLPRKLSRRKLVTLVRKLAERHEIFARYFSPKWTFEEVYDIVDAPLYLEDAFELVNYRVGLTETGERYYEEIKCAMKPEMFYSIVRAVREVAKDV